MVGKRDKMWAHRIFLNRGLANLKTSQSKLLQIDHFCKDGGFFAIRNGNLIEVLTFYKIEKTMQISLMAVGGWLGDRAALHGW